jgi:hypothetical protein
MRTATLFGLDDISRDCRLHWENRRLGPSANGAFPVSPELIDNLVKTKKARTQAG